MKIRLFILLKEINNNYDSSSMFILNSERSGKRILEDIVFRWKN